MEGCMRLINNTLVELVIELVNKIKTYVECAPAGLARRRPAAVAPGRGRAPAPAAACMVESLYRDGCVGEPL